MRSLLAWFGLLALAFVNGAIREVGMKQVLGVQEPWAHQLSCLTGVVIWTAFTFAVWEKLRIRSFKSSLAVGFAWFVATGLFETFVLNRNLSWTEIAKTYDFLDGEFWGLALCWIGIMPNVIYWVKKMKNQRVDFGGNFR